MTSATRLHRVRSAALMLALLAQAGCSPADETDISGSSSRDPFREIAETHANADDGTYEARGAATVKLADGSSTVTGAGATVTGDVVTITEVGTYVLSGSLSDGQVIVNSPGVGKVNLVLDGVDIRSASTSPLVVTAADEAVVILADGAKNTLSDSLAAGADDEQPGAPTATLFSAADLTIAGTGSLAVDGWSKDGIVSNDGLVILAGTVAVDALDDAIGGKDYLVIDGGTLSLTAGGDGLKSKGDTAGALGRIRIDGGKATIRSVAHGIAAEGSVTVTGGTVKVAKSEDGIKSRVIAFSGGTVSVTANADGIKATSGTGAPRTIESGVGLTISGGRATIDAGGDGIDSRGSATITGGVVTIDKASKDTIDVLGATTTLDAVTLSLDAPGKVELTETDGDVVARFTATKAGSHLLMAKGLTAGEKYSVTVNGKKARKVKATDRL